MGMFTFQSCRAFRIVQQADTNASRNHLLNSSFLVSGRYRAWAWKLMPLKGGDTPSMQVEARQLAPEAEYASRSPKAGVPPSRGLGQLQAPFAPQQPSQRKKKKRSVPVTDESLIQLRLWDFGMEIGAEG